MDTPYDRVEMVEKVGQTESSRSVVSVNKYDIFYIVIVVGVV